MIEKNSLIKLRDCFTAGYQMPQFCIDNNIQKPLIVGMNESQVSFLWELHVQFQYDRRMTAEFALIQGEKKNINLPSQHYKVIADMILKNISDMDLDKFDKIIILANGNENNPKIIYLYDLLEYFISRTYTEIPLAHFVQKNSGVILIAINYPFLNRNNNNSDFEKKILDRKDAGERIFIGDIRNKIKSAKLKGETIPTPYDFLGYSNDDVYNLLEVPGQKINADGSIYLNDSEFLGIKNGRRITAYQPENYENKIYFVGNCIYYGYGVPFDKTVESYLQKMLNEKNLPYRVENESTFLDRRGQDVFYNLNKLHCNPGDIIFIVLPENAKDMLALYVDNVLNGAYNYGEVFADDVHINENGHRVLAEYIFKVLTDNNFFRAGKIYYPKNAPPSHRYGIPQEVNFKNAELEEYKKKLREKRFQVGAIVMNCNPFTFGHEYLIEYASKRVEKLFIFVVEEDKSEFKFADRFELVRRGVKKFSNVEVLPSGKFIISQQTFSGYFNKENLQDVLVDSSEDVEIFAREIAPSLGITIRFVGEEPEDSVTRQYNENMKRILPRYNIELCEIPRKILNGEIISAKKVREALHLKDFDKIKKLVPKTTLKFLLENFG